MSWRYSTGFGARQLKKGIKYFLASLYPLVIRIWPLPRVLSIEETIEVIKVKRVSFARFGDGEFLYIMDKLDLPFQRYDESLASTLREILKSDRISMMVGLPSGYHGLHNLKASGRLFWKSQITWIYPRLHKHLLRSRVYGNASMTRLYHEVEDKQQSIRYFELVQGLWDKREVVIVEGAQSRFGVGNDLLHRTQSIQRILAPPHHAYEVLPSILEVVKEQPTSKLILVALGPAAKALVFKLTQIGFQAIDVGNLDIEYEWFLRGATEKMKIPGKYTSEAVGGRIVDDIVDVKYLSEIIADVR